ncbi:aminomethyltransferase family protein [Dehalococcoidia bacterium]|nr:aminomethyltransferase family protein [Dehalococcoidia bacterium]
MNRTPLHEIQKLSGATFKPVNDWEIVNTFGDETKEYQAARDGVALLDRSCAGRFIVRGRDALDLLNRLSTNKVDTLLVGTGQGTILSTNKGRVIDLIHIFVLEDHLLVMTSPETRERVAEWVDMYTFLEDVTLEDVTESTAMISILGSQATVLLKRVTGTQLANMTPYSSTYITINGALVVLLCTAPTGVPSYDIIVPTEYSEMVWSILMDTDVDVTPVGECTFNTLRVEAGIPRYGWEVSEEVNPWEVKLDPFIHSDKGCYIGQEVILRLDTYRKIQRLLMALTFSSTDISEGDRLCIGNDEKGRITSVVKHPISGELIGLGLIRSAFVEDGAELEVVDIQGNFISKATMHEPSVNGPSPL